MHGTAKSSGGGIRYPRLYDFLIFLLTRGRESAYRENLLDIADIVPGQSFLDIGCGTGTLALAASRRVGPGGAVTGVDVSEKMVSLARRKTRRARADIPFHVAGASRLPFADSGFDAAAMTTVLHMIPDGERQSALAEARRVLRSGGRLVLVDYAGGLESRRHLSARHGPHGAFDLHACRETLRELGFRAISEGPLGWLDLHFMAAEKA
ncbi:methyltransferase domain-containing protein [Parvibaculum sp.]|uniref:class I SAM-dependent methyltransferase n=1 Tax=Parvibaculum sp. TaxID=2024848 RepID=UPI001B29E5B9|nr:methyltransferase domain-containing protein [Parvibaculum sp.]MBO6677575.1 methyltransferase domain-containing protein [Parvibaculum sp.]MBO6685916.1 methyltransferase domain-containing protein [Parvibaculum sp.]MBO6904962.1 methyltransferase domain-containing protein [Parvibaculum sp.]